MSSTTSAPRRLSLILAAAAALAIGAPAAASADGIQPATSSCVVQGEGTPCTLTSSSISAPSESPAEASAVNWAQAQEGSTAWDGYCLEFVYLAYQNAGVDITQQAGLHDSAIDFWNTYTGAKNPPSENPPAGALVFWAPTPGNPAGHVAISEGNGLAISTEERSYPGVHELTIAYRDAQGYQQLGWIMPA